MKNLYKIGLVALIVFSIQSCAVRKNYVRPDLGIKTENLFRTDQLPQDSISMATVKWEELFTDAILQDYVKQGLENNLDIRMALQTINEASAYLKQSKLGYLPSVNGNVQGGHTQISKNNGQFGGGSFNQFDLGANLSWELDVWAKIKNIKDASNASYLQSLAAHQAVKTKLISQIASTYYQLVSIDAQVEVTKTTLENRKHSIAVTKALKDAGDVTEVGVKQTEAQLYVAQSLLVDLEKSTKLLENTLSILIGKEPQKIARSNLNTQNFTTELTLGVSADLLKNRPDLIAAEYNLMNAFELTNVAKANFYPSFRITAGAGLQSSQLNNLISIESVFANILAGLTQPIFNQGKIKAQHRIAIANQEIALLNFRKALLNASKEVNDALFIHDAENQKINYKEKEVTVYSKAVEYSEELLNNGMINYLEVLTAKENKLNSQLSLIQFKYNKLNAIVTLYQSLGGGWR